MHTSCLPQLISFYKKEDKISIMGIKTVIKTHYKATEVTAKHHNSLQ